MSYRNPSLSQRPQLNTERPRWRITEGRGGVIQQRDESASRIARVFSQDGALLAEAEAHGQDPRLADAERGQGVGVVGRLLRYYFGHGGRRVVLQDQHGSRWHGRISGTHWLSSGRVWSFAGDQKKAVDKRP